MGRGNICVNGPDNMTKIGATPIYGNTFKIFPRTQSPMILKLGMQLLGLKLYKISIELMMTLD